MKTTSSSSSNTSVTDCIHQLHLIHKHITDKTVLDVVREKFYYSCVCKILFILQ